jgi:hypothetical protein
MSHLSEIFLDGNKFLKVPESLALVGKSLQYLYLNNNPIEKIADDAFSGNVIEFEISRMFVELLNKF